LLPQPQQRNLFLRFDSKIHGVLQWRDARCRITQEAISDRHSASENLLGRGHKIPRYRRLNIKINNLPTCLSTLERPIDIITQTNRIVWQDGRYFRIKKTPARLRRKY